MQLNHGGIIICSGKGGDSAYIVYIISGKRTVWLGSLQGLYALEIPEYKFNQVDTCRRQPHRRECITEGHSSVLYDLNYGKYAAIFRFKKSTPEMCGPFVGKIKYGI